MPEAFTSVVCLFCGATIQETDTDERVARVIQHKLGCNWGHGTSCTCHRCLVTRRRLLAEAVFWGLRAGVAHPWDCLCDNCQALREAWSAVQPPAAAQLEERDADDN